MSILTLKEDTKTIITKMSQGNPGAIICLCDIINIGNTIDPITYHPLSYILQLDSIGIYGSQIYILYNDICNKQLTIMFSILRAIQIGYIPVYKVKNAIKNDNQLNINDIMLYVKNYLGPTFASTYDYNIHLTKVLPL